MIREISVWAHVLMLGLCIIWFLATFDLEPIIAFITCVCSFMAILFGEKVVKTFSKKEKPRLRKLSFNKKKWTNISVEIENVRSITSSPIDPKEIWIGTNGTESNLSTPKLYKSSAGGLNWGHLSKNKFYNKFKDSVRQISISNDNCLYIAVGHCLLVYDLYTSKWSINYEDKYKDVRCFAFHPYHNTLIARGLGKERSGASGGMSSGASILKPQPNRIENKISLADSDFHLWDDYSQGFIGIDIKNVNAIAVSKLDSSQMLLGTSDKGVFKLENETVFSIGDMKDVLSISYSQWSTNTIFVGTKFKGAFVSHDSGNTWSKIEGIPNCQAIKFAFSEKINGLIWLATSQGVFQSNNFGATWVQDNKGLDHLWVMDICLNVEGDIFAATCGGVFKKSEKQENWENINYGLSCEISYSDSIILSPSSIICASMRSVYLTLNKGVSWKSVGYFDSIIYSLLFIETSKENRADIHFSKDFGKSFLKGQMRQGFLFVGRETGEISITNDYGRNWKHSKISQGTIYTLKNFLDNIYAGTEDGLYFSKDLGKNWAKLTDFCVLEIFIFEETIYIGTSDGKLLKSNDFGETWSQTSHASNKPIWSICNYNETFFYGTEGNGIYMSKDFGNTWVELDNSPSDKVLSLLIDNKRSNCVLFAGTPNGVFKSTNNGKSWQAFDKGILGSKSVFKLAHNESHRFLIACMANKGIYRVNI